MSQAFKPRAYTPSFDWQGNVNDVTTIGAFSQIYGRQSGDPLTTETAVMTILTSSVLCSHNFESNDPSKSGDDSEVLLDNVSVRPVPEPSTAAASDLGRLALLRRRNRRQEG